MDDLVQGETFRTLFDSIQVQRTERVGPPAYVYNLEVDGDHTYCVGENGILVHNSYGSIPLRNSVAQRSWVKNFVKVCQDEYRSHTLDHPRIKEHVLETIEHVTMEEAQLNKAFTWQDRASMIEYAKQILSETVFNR